MPQEDQRRATDKVGRWKVRMLPMRGDRWETPQYEINGVTYTKAEWREIMARMKEKKSGNLCGKNYCSECKAEPCVAEVSGSTSVLQFARMMRKTSPTVHLMHSRCLQQLVSTESFQSYMLQNDSGEIPYCARLWVDARCCMNLKS